MTANDALQLAKDALDKAHQEKENARTLVQSIGPAVVDALKPTLEENSRAISLGLAELAKAVSNLKIEAPDVSVPQAEVKVEIPEIKVPQPVVNVTIPDIKVPEAKEVKIPAIKVPKPEVIVNVPPIKVPEIQVPEAKVTVNFPETIRAIIVDKNGKPQDLNAGSTVVGGGGGGSRMTAIKPYATESVPISASSAGDNTLVAAVSGMRICVFGWMVQAAGTTSPKFTDTVKDLTGAYSFQAREGATSPTVTPPTYLFATGVGKPLVINLSDAVSVTGFVSYFLLP